MGRREVMGRGDDETEVMGRSTQHILHAKEHLVHHFGCIKKEIIIGFLIEF